MQAGPQRSLHRLWPVLICTGVLMLLAAPSIAQHFTPSPSYSTTDRFVGAHFFHWYSMNNRNLGDWEARGPWRPLEGRTQWDGSVAFYKRQIKDVMDAQIDVIHVHLWLPESGDQQFEESRKNLFRALYELRYAGYDTPKVVPFLDGALTWYSGNPLNLATTAGKNDFVNQYIRFFDQYFQKNTDAYARDYLAQINNKVILNTWHLLYRPQDGFYISNYQNLSRNDVQSRLASRYGGVFNNGVYMIGSTAWPVPSWFDEITDQYTGNGYYESPIWNGKRTACLKPGLWTENIVPNARFEPRDGGNHFWNSWLSLNNEKNGNPKIYHAIIESWNEYDEGSGLYEANTTPYYLFPPDGYNPGTNSDTWSIYGNYPRAYIDIVANRAPIFTGAPTHDAEFIYQNVPASVAPGATFNISVIVRNKGSNEWRRSTNYKLGFSGGTPFRTPSGGIRYLLNDSQDEIPKYGGIFRGRPRTFNVQVKAPTSPGTHDLRLRMVQENVTWFGEELVVPIQVGTASGPATVNFGNSDVQSGLRRYTPEPGHGNTMATTIGGRNCRRSVNGNDRHFFMLVDDSWAFQGNKPAVDVTITYYDSGTDAINLVYDGTGGNRFAGGVNLTNTNTWKTKTWTLTDAYFGNRSGFGYDFRLSSKSAGTIMYIDTVQISE